MKMSRAIVISCLLLIIFSVSQVVSSQGTEQAEVQIDALVPGCGDQIIGVGEDCDGISLAGESCLTKGYTSGLLSCTASCVFNTSACVYNPPSSGGGSGGGSGISNKATVVLVGKAYPASTVTIIKDGQIVAKTVASPMANFQVAVTGLSAGSYVFMVYGEDTKGLRSPLLSFPVMISRGTLTKIEDIFIAPTISLDKSEVRKGDIITIFGQSVPMSEITLEVNSPQQFFTKTIVDKGGAYLHNFDTSVLDTGDHSTQSRSATNTEISPLSSKAQFQVGTKNVYSSESMACSKKADFNGDCRVNLVDFSIVAFWYNRPLNPVFVVREKEHLNGDGKINLVDFSIMAFHWTG